MLVNSGLCMKCATILQMQVKVQPYSLCFIADALDIAKPHLSQVGRFPGTIVALEERCHPTKLPHLATHHFCSIVIEIICRLVHCRHTDHQVETKNHSGEPGLVHVLTVPTETHLHKLFPTRDRV